MGLTTKQTTVVTISCDLQGCGKSFDMPDNPDENTPGSENIVSLTIGKINSTVYFCGFKHLIAFALAYAKATPPAAKPSRAHMAMEELESIPRMENLSLKDEK
jgi:hypothetical protein